MLRLAPNGRYAMCAKCPKSVVVPGRMPALAQKLRAATGNDVEGDSGLGHGRLQSGPGKGGYRGLTDFGAGLAKV